MRKSTWIQNPAWTAWHISPTCPCWAHLFDNSQLGCVKRHKSNVQTCDRRHLMTLWWECVETQMTDLLRIKFPHGRTCHERIPRVVVELIHCYRTPKTMRNGKVSHLCIVGTTHLWRSAIQRWVQQCWWWWGPTWSLCVINDIGRIRGIVHPKVRWCIHAFCIRNVICVSCVLTLSTFFSQSSGHTFHMPKIGDIDVKWCNI